MVSLKTIAEKCGVSTATVSKALNDQKDISEETKSRIRTVAEQLGYFPNAAARSLKTNHSYNLGVLFEEEAGRGLQHEYFSGVLNGLKVQAEKQGYDITFINTCFENRKMSYLEHCKYRNFEGVAIVCADFNDPGVMELMNSEVPVVTIDYLHHNCTAGQLEQHSGHGRSGQIYLFSGTQEDRLHPRTAEWFGSYQRPVDKFLPDNG